MLDRDLIQNRGFANVVVDGEVVGFQLRFRIPSYRGLWASLINGVDVVVDGERFDRTVMLWTLGGADYTYEQLRTTADLHWQLDEAATVTVPRPGGLTPGLHGVSIDLSMRMSYIPLEHQPTVLSASRLLTIVPEAVGRLKYGVSLFSYTGDYGVVMDLDDAMAEISDLGATGIEILGEGHVKGYPNPSTEWRDAWFAKLEKYRLTPTNYGSWIDTRLWDDRDLSAEEGAKYLSLDIELASQLGFSFVRPKIGVVSAELQPHPIWDEVIDRCLQLAADRNIVICPEIHSPTPLKSQVVEEYIEFIERTGTKNFGLLVDTGIFQTQATPTKPKVGEKLGDGKRPAWLDALAVPMADLEAVLPYVVFIQAKFQHIDDDLVDNYIPWTDIIRTLNDGGWTGYLSSEYEGEKIPWHAAEQVRRQHALLRSIERDIVGG